MKLGIKVGLRSDWKNDLLATRPDFCEIWFDSRKINDYEALFSFLKNEHIPAGIHFWGATPDGTLCNLAYPDKDILQTSRNLARITLEKATSQNALYVNFHPCGKLLSRVDFEKEEFTPYTNVSLLTKSLSILNESFTDLAYLSNKLGVILTLESTPQLALGNPWTGKQGRKNPISIGEFLVHEIEPLFSEINDLYFANDFGHTCGNVVTNDRQVVFDTVANIARRLAFKTKLLHVSYIIPPYNGTDYHGCLYYDEFRTDIAIPNHYEMLTLLKLFKNRPDVFALVEPEKDHPRNFQALKQLVTELT